MKLSQDQMSVTELKKLKIGDRVIIHWQTAPKSIWHINGFVSHADWRIFRVKYFAIPENKDWETAFFWNWLDSDGTFTGDYSWSFSKP